MVAIEAQSATYATEAAVASQPTLIVVDDDPEVRTIISEFLEDSGYRVLQADGGARALTLLESHPETQVVVTDIRMPDMSGVELADRATRRWGGIKVILISGYSATHRPGHRFLRKPFRMQELAAAIQCELEG
jgi:CheY-like chemotaxis protein